MPFQLAFRMRDHVRIRCKLWDLCGWLELEFVPGHARRQRLKKEERTLIYERVVVIKANCSLKV